MRVETTERVQTREQAVTFLFDDLDMQTLRPELYRRLLSALKKHDVVELAEGIYNIALHQKDSQKRQREAADAADAFQFHARPSGNFEDIYRRAYEQVYGQEPKSGGFEGFDFGRFDTDYSAFTRSKPSTGWWTVLGLPATATKNDAKQAYRKLAMKHHPDRGGDAATFQKITKAYEEAMKQ